MTSERVHACYDFRLSEWDTRGFKSAWFSTPSFRPAPDMCAFSGFGEAFRQNEA